MIERFTMQTSVQRSLPRWQAGSANAAAGTEFLRHRLKIFQIDRECREM